MNQENYQEQRKIPSDNFTQLTCVKDHYYLKKKSIHIHKRTSHYSCAKVLPTVTLTAREESLTGLTG